MSESHERSSERKSREVFHTYSAQTCEALSPVVPTELSAVPALVHVAETCVFCGSVVFPTHALKTTSARLLK